MKTKNNWQLILIKQQKEKEQKRQKQGNQGTENDQGGPSFLRRPETIPGPQKEGPEGDPGRWQEKYCPAHKKNHG